MGDRFTRTIQSASMRKNNIDAHYNNKVNKYRNSFIVELNKLIYFNLRNTYYCFKGGNDIIFSKGSANISVDDKAAVLID